MDFARTRMESLNWAILVRQRLIKPLYPSRGRRRGISRLVSLMNLSEIYNSCPMTQAPLKFGIRFTYPFKAILFRLRSIQAHLTLHSNAIIFSVYRDIRNEGCWPSSRNWQFSVSNAEKVLHGIALQRSRLQLKGMAPLWNSNFFSFARAVCLFPEATGGKYW